MSWGLRQDVVTEAREFRPVKSAHACRILLVPRKEWTKLQTATLCRVWGSGFGVDEWIPRMFF